MIHQPLPNSKGGTIEAINYMCNERLKDGTARVLRGNPNLTKKIVQSIKFKQKLHVGVLSFEEANLDEDTKILIMNSFERVLLPKMKGRYNILWVEHSDKGRLELNYLIPKIDLPTQKSLTPYFDTLDRHRIKIWRDIQNLLHKLSDPNDPRKSQVISNDKRIKLFEDYKKLNEQLHELVSKNRIQNREQLIALLNKSNIETKAYKTYITVKFPNSKKVQKLKGGIYHEEFRSIRAITDICNRRREEISQYNNQDTQTIYKALRQKLDEYTRKKGEYFRRKFVECENTNRKHFESEYEKHRNRNDTKFEKESENQLYIDNINNSDNDNTILVHSSQLHDKSITYKEEKYDSYRAIIESIRRERESKQQALQRVRTQGETICLSIERNLNNLRAEHEEYKGRLSEDKYFFNQGNAEIIRRSSDNKWEWEAILGTTERIANAIKEIGNRYEQYDRRCSKSTYNIRNRYQEYKRRIGEFKELIVENKTSTEFYFDTEKLDEIFEKSKSIE